MMNKCAVWPTELKLSFVWLVVCVTHAHTDTLYTHIQNDIMLEKDALNA